MKKLPLAKPPERAEFTAEQDTTPGSQERRDFLKLAGASLALAGVTGCSRAPRGKIVPYAAQPPEVTPGVATHFATTLTREGYGIGVVVESHEGRPTKIEGNPDHSASLGGSGIFEQASLLDLYDRDRAKRIYERGRVSSWPTLIAKLLENKPDRGRGVHLLLEPTSSPLTASLLTRLREKLPEAATYFHAPLASVRAWAGARLAFGETLETQVDFRKADVVLSIDSDFLTSGPASLRHARHFAERRRMTSPSDALNRLYVIEPSPTVTGSSADHRLRCKRADIPTLVRALFAQVATRVGNPAALAIANALHLQVDHAHEAFVRALAEDLVAHRGRSAVVVGEAQPPVVHALGHAINELLANIGFVIAYAASPILEAGEAHSLTDLSAALAADGVDTLLILGGNPVYASPADLDLAKLLRRAKRSIYLGAHENETAAACMFLVPQAHALASWGTARAFDGTQSLVQPLTATDENEKTVDEALASFLDDFRSTPTAHDLVRSWWRLLHPSDFDISWREALRKGTVADTAFPTKSPHVDWPALANALAREPAAAPSSTLEIALREDPRVRDGASTNNPWLLELPDPVTKLTWENAALVSKTTATKLGLASGDVVNLKVGGFAVEAPVLIVQGQTEDSISLTFGYGKKSSETIADGVGANAYALQRSAAPWGGENLVVEKTTKRANLALAQTHFSIEGRAEEIALSATLTEFRKSPDFAKPRNAEKKSLYVLPQGSPRQWGMVVDLAACTGCSACVVACQAENNIAVVGKAGVLKGREMHWMRIDRYVETEDDDARPISEPMLCQHCEKAPCEYVCPTNATTHSSDGLNQMVYNRCVGTRFCSNNCPWKVRRFNWFDYDQDPDAADPRVHNPDVTVRSRGVMEKCTYCVQRIREVEIRSKVEGREVRDHDVKTACEQACPSAAIVFGDIGSSKTDVSEARRNPRLFAVLNDLGTVPHTRYLAKIENPNEDLD